MHEINGIPRAASKLSWLIGAGLLLLGVILGRTLFPLEVPTPFVVEKRVEVPTERIIEKRVEVPVDRIVEKRVEVPVERVVERRVMVPVDRIVEKRVLVPFEVIKYVDRFTPFERATFPERTEPFVRPHVERWAQLHSGMGSGAVRDVLGAPKKIESGTFSRWYYGDVLSDGTVTIHADKLDSWNEPVR